ncbi:hypothetical protein [Legionella bozemanae]|uniref:Chromosome partition protein Smc n=1 Tax=Legionella bozemanae TaxID=447 RepID=A0A0W0RQP0_LEGBO|nr:hypothetical protein [Legionella bozemanae]KTC73392.1 Chromosome partition protein Smc [Legionella bozemanae]STO34510.1 ATPase involved in DNA repair [Legionella bozemanae]
MPSLKANELSQWTDGDADLLSKLLLYLFLFMKTATNKGKDTNSAYKRVEENIRNFISVRGDDRLHIPVLNRASIDASALLGAYLRQDIVLKGKPIVELSEEQIQVVYDFVKPLIPEGFTPKKFFDSLEGSPAKKHVTILKLLIFKGIPTEDQQAMFKPKYAKKVDDLLDSILNLVEFMRTPFNVLDLEEIASKAAAKQLGKEQASTSGIDLQWASLYNAINRCLQDIITLKKGKIGKAEEFLDQIKQFLGTCQKCFGVANAGYKIKKEVLAEVQKQETEQSEALKILGFPEGNPAKINHYITAFRESLIQKEPEKAEAINNMTLTQLINTYAAQWQAALDKIKRELLSSKEELQKTKDTLQQKESVFAESEIQLQSIKQQHETLKLQLDEANRQLKQQHSELERLQKVESTSKETITKLKEEIERIRIDIQQKSTALVQLEEQFQAVKKENEELKSKLSVAQKHEQTVLELQKQLESLRQENVLLQQRLLEAEKQPSKSSSEGTSEVSELRSRLESLQQENELLRQPRDVGKQAKASSSEIAPEVAQLRSQLEFLQNENSQLKEALRQQTQPMPKEQPAPLDLSAKKADLLLALGALRLNMSDMIKIKDKIMTSKEVKQLLEVNTEIKCLQKINEFIENINKGILERAGFFSSDPHKKTKAIETAFQELSVSDKYKIATLSEESINEELSRDSGEESDIGKFLKAIHHKRGFIPIHQATSFTFFKSKISALDQELQQINSPIQVL